MRCFISIDLDEGIRKSVIKIQDVILNMGADVKLVMPENLHFTVKFLGDVNENEIEVVRKSLCDCLDKERYFKLNVAGIGYFGSTSHIRTLWLGVNQGRDNLVKLMKNVNEHVKLGDNKITPHLTLGRIKSARNREFLLKFIEGSKNVNIGEMDVKEVKLKSSQLTGKGPVYSDMCVFRLRDENE